MSEYLEELRKQAADGIELAGEDFRALIHVDCHNVVKLLDKIDQLTADRDTLLEALKYTTIEIERAGVHHSIVRQYKELFDKMGG